MFLLHCTILFLLYNLGLMIGAFAKAGCILKDDVYLKRAIKAASFVKKYLWNEEKRKLTRSCYKGDDGEIVQLYVSCVFDC